jgi:hypothetical protein
MLCERFVLSALAAELGEYPSSLAFCLINLIIDIVYAFLDPKIKSQYN